MNRKPELDRALGDKAGRGQQDLSDKIIVGKDILELLSSSMYVDPLSVYREYLQNAVDSVDQAVEGGQLTPIEAEIQVNIDREDRRILIRDNGTGIEPTDFRDRMLSFGASNKRGTNARGFRGVGRLSGIGFCQELVFRTRLNGEPYVREMVWDCRKVKKGLAEHEADVDLHRLVGEVVSFGELDASDYPDRFFEVELRKPIRLGNDRLLNGELVSAYLSQISPVPFHPEFELGEQISKTISQADGFGEYQIFVNGAAEPLYRPHRNEVYYSDIRRGRATKVDTFAVEAVDGEMAAIGWLLHHDYQGAIPSSAGVRGLRARTGNIQIGNHDLFADVFKERRFNSWAIGEVHIVDKRLIPNGRRDGFEHNTHFANLTNQLTAIGNNVSRYCRHHSAMRNRIRNFELAEEKILAQLEILAQGAVSKRMAGQIKRDIGSRFAELEKSANSEFVNVKIQKGLAKRAKKLALKVAALSENGVNDDKLNGVPTNRRAGFQMAIDLIFECSPNEVVAKSLVDKMMARISKF